MNPYRNLSFGRLSRRLWPYFLVGSILLATAFCLSVNVKTKPNERERFTVFIGLEENAVQSVKLEQKVKEIDPLLKEVRVISCPSTSSLFSSFQESYEAHADLFLLPESSIQEEDYKRAHLLPSEFQIEGCLNQKGYPLSGASEKAIADYCAWGETSCYLFWGATSVHLKPYESSALTDDVPLLWGALLG